MELTREERERIYHEEAVRLRKAGVEPQRAGKPGAGCAIALLLPLVFVGCCTMLGKANPPTAAEQAASNDSADASSAESEAQDFVKPRLKAPATAEFPSMWNDDSHITKLGTGSYCVYSWVDSQNSFGAKLRMHYTCRLHKTSDNSWELDSLTTDQD